MKKLLLLILVLAICVLPLTFAACSNVSQANKLFMSYACDDGGSELFTYTVYYQETPIGTMTMRFSPMTNAALDLESVSDPSGKVHIDAFTGTMLSVDLETTELLDKDSTDPDQPTHHTIHAFVLYSAASFSPAYSYRHSVINGVDEKMQVSYNGKYLQTYYYINGEEQPSSEVKASGYYDDEMLYALVRASDVGSSSYSFSFSCFSPKLNASDTLKITRKGAVEETSPVLKPLDFTPSEETPKHTVPCYEFSITTDNPYASSFTMTVTQKSQTVENEQINIANVKKIIVTIKEGDRKYVLSDVKVINPAK